MKKLLELIKKNKKNKKKVIVSSILVVAVASLTGVYFYNNNKEYNEMLVKLETEVGYSNSNLFWSDNTFVKTSTIDYMNYIYDTQMNDINQNLEFLNTFVDENEIPTTKEQYQFKIDELTALGETTYNWLTNYTTDNSIDLVDDTLYTNITLVETEMTNKNSNNFNSLTSITSKDLTDSEKKTKDKLNDTKEEIETTMSSEDLTLVKLETLNEDINNLNKDIKDFNEEVKERKKEDEEKEQALANNTSSNSTNTWTGNNTWSSNNTSSNASSNTSSNTSSGGSSNTTQTVPSYCEYVSEANAIADGKASGRGWSVTSCGIYNGEEYWFLTLFDAHDLDPDGGGGMLDGLDGW